MATLLRKAVQFPEVTEATLNDKVAKEAEQYLGYSFGERRNKEVTAKLSAREQLVKVQKCLKSCGIVPLDEKSVLRYQARARQNAQRRSGRSATFTSRWRWRFVNTEDYHAEIPQFALARATAVARTLSRRMPSLKKNFAVSELHQTRVRRFDPDPFMVLQVLDHNFYLDAWDEPSFEGRRTV